VTKFGLTQEQYEFILQEIVVPLDKQGAVVYCFGSRARGDHQKNSDLDLMVVCEELLTSEISSMLEVLQDSNFPFTVDLVQEQNFAEAYIDNYLSERQLFKTDNVNVRREGSPQ
jgi:predicted nucleotidyltransferase